MALENVSAILITAGLKFELRTEILKNNYVILIEIKDAALKAERLRKKTQLRQATPRSMKSMRKKLKLMQSITGPIIKTTTEATIQKVEEDTQLPGEATEDHSRVTIKEHHQPPKAEAHIEEIVVTKTKTTEEAKTPARTMTATTRTSVNIAKHLATLWKNVGNSKPRNYQ
jgi:hypothetical protein